MAQETFEAALSEGYRAIPCYRVGAIAIHRCPSGTRRGSLWFLSHVETGLALPSLEIKRLSEAKAAAERIGAAVDWSRIRRGRHIGSPACLSVRVAKRIREACEAVKADLRPTPSLPRIGE